MTWRSALGVSESRLGGLCAFGLAATLVLTVSLSVQQDVARGIYASLPLDPFYVVIFGGVALWTLAVSGSSLLSANMPRALCYVGVVLAAGYLLLVVSLAAGSLSLFAFAAVVTGVLLGPIWYIWLGVLLTARPR